MNEGNRFVVEIVGQLQETREVTVSRVCDALGLDEARAAALVARMPGIITRPAGEDRAMKIAMRLQEAGLTALHRPLAEGEDPFRARERPAEVVPGRPKLAPDVAPPPAIDQGHAIDPRPADGAPVPEVAPDEVAPDVAAAEAAAPLEAEVPEPGPADAAPFEAEAPDAEPSPRGIPSLDATHHDIEPDPKLTPMSEAGFGAADIVLPTQTTQTTPERPRPRATFVEAGSTAVPSPDDDDPAQTMVRAATEVPTPHPDASPPEALDGEPPERPLTPVSPVLELGRDDARAGDDAPAAATATPRPDGSGVAPKYRQTRSSAEPALTLSAPPEEVLKRSGVPEAELGSGRSRGRLGRHLAAQVALPGLLTWSLTAVALWWFLGSDRAELFVVLAAASALAALTGSLIAALGTMGLARDVVRLRDEARRVAMGDLTAPVASNRDDELGEIAGSLERMRLSLQEGMERLRQRRR